MNKIEVLCHSSIKIIGEKVIYFDPFRIEKEYHDADIIYITHSHYDHFSEEDIKKVKKDNTYIIITQDIKDRALKLGFKEEDILTVVPNENYEVSGISFQTIPAYNTNKQFHPRENEWVGYLVKIDDIVYYIAGDTDITKENQKVICDIAFVPVGGTYTMNFQEAAQLINEIKPKKVIPIHYQTIVGTKKDAEEFGKLLATDIPFEILY